MLSANTFFSGTVANTPAVPAQNNHGSKVDMALTDPPPLLIGLLLQQQI